MRLALAAVFSSKPPPHSAPHANRAFTRRRRRWCCWRWVSPPLGGGGCGGGCGGGGCGWGCCRCCAGHLHCAREDWGAESATFEVDPRLGQLRANDLIVFVYLTAVEPGDGGLALLPGSQCAAAHAAPHSAALAGIVVVRAVAAAVAAERGAGVQRAVPPTTPLLTRRR